MRPRRSRDRAWHHPLERVWCISIRSWLLLGSSQLRIRRLRHADLDLLSRKYVKHSFLGALRERATPMGRSTWVASPVLSYEPLRFGRYQRCRHAQPCSHSIGHSAEVVVVDAPEWRMRIVSKRPLYAPRGLLIGEPRCQLQRHVYFRRHARREDELAVLDPPLRS